MRKSAVLALCFSLFIAAGASAELYRWVDRDGREFFTNEREKVPPEYRNSAVPVTPAENRVSIGSATAGKTGPAVRSAEHRDRYGKGEEYWRKRATKLRRELADLQYKYDKLLAENKDAKPRKASSSGSKGKDTKTAYEKKKEKLERDLARKRRELEVDLPEEARKADALPGWIRE